MQNYSTRTSPDTHNTFHKLREPCKECHNETGVINERNGQACLFCAECGRFQYNVPKKERGLVPETVRTCDISPSLRYKIAERAKFRCEFCGRDATVMNFHIAHLVSVEDLMTARVPEHFYNHPDNLAWLCAECNLGMGKKSLSLHDVLVYTMRRQAQGGNSAR